MKISIPRVLIFFVAILATVIFPASAAIEVNEVFDLSLIQFVPCAASGAGENVDLAGPLHILLTFTINGNNVSGVSHANPQGISGTGETTGDKYQGTGVTQTSFKTSFQNGQANATLVNNFRIIGPGPGNNFLVHETAHIVINANGTVTVNHDNLGVDCK